MKKSKKEKKKKEASKLYHRDGSKFLLKEMLQEIVQYLA